MTSLLLEELAALKDKMAVGSVLPLTLCVVGFRPSTAAFDELRAQLLDSSTDLECHRAPYRPVLTCDLPFLDDDKRVRSTAIEAYVRLMSTRHVVSLILALRR
jgi:hypothetical protein